MGDVTPGLLRHQLIATCAGDLPVSSATRNSASITPHVYSLLYAVQFSPQPFSSAVLMRVPSIGAVNPRRYLPLSQPPRSGLHGITPRPSFWQTGITSHSVLRHSKLYCG